MRLKILVRLLYTILGILIFYFDYDVIFPPKSIELIYLNDKEINESLFSDKEIIFRIFKEKSRRRYI